MSITPICNIQDAIGKPCSQGFSFKLFKQQITFLIENLKINVRIIFYVLGIAKRFSIRKRFSSEKHDKLLACLLYFFEDSMSTTECQLGFKTYFMAHFEKSTPQNEPNQTRTKPE